MSGGLARRKGCSQTGVVVHEGLPCVSEVEVDGVALGVVREGVLVRREVPHLFRQRCGVVFEVCLLVCGGQLWRGA